MSAALPMRPRAATAQHCRRHAAHSRCPSRIQRARFSYGKWKLIGAPSLTAVAGKERSERNNKEESLSVQLGCILYDNGEVDDHGDDVLKDAARLISRKCGGWNTVRLDYYNPCKRLKGPLGTLHVITFRLDSNANSPLDGPCRTLCADEILALR